MPMSEEIEEMLRDLYCQQFIEAVAAILVHQDTQDPPEEKPGEPPTVEE
jgi:hypothetical protein